MHRDAGGADRMALRFEAARGIDRQLAVLGRPAFARWRARLRPCGVRPMASYSMSSAMVKQSCVSTKERSDKCRAGRAHGPSSRPPCSLRNRRCRARDIGRKSCTWAMARKCTALGKRRAVSVSHSTMAAAPSETSEQSVRRNGPGDQRILVGDGVAEFDRQFLAQLRVGIVRRHSCGSWRRSGRAPPTGRHSAGNRVRRCARKCRQSRPACRLPRVR